MSRYEQRGKTSFRLIVDLGYDAKGKRIRPTKTIRVPSKLLTTPKKLEEHLDLELAKFQMEVQTGIHFVADKIKIADFVEVWREKFVETKLEYKTIENYLHHAKKRIVPYFGHMRVDAIKPLHIETFLQELSTPGSRQDGKEGGLGSASLVYIYRVLQSIFSKAVAWKVIKENPMDGVDKPKEAKPRNNAYDEVEAIALFQAMEAETLENRIMFTLALTTGMRRAEILGLEESHIDFERNRILISQSIPAFRDKQPVIKLPKNDSSIRSVTISAFLLKELKELILEKKKQRMACEEPLWRDGTHRFLFSHSTGIPYYPKRLHERWVSFHKRHPGLRYIRFHDLRHTSATLLINNNVHTRVISGRLGHSNATTTLNVYGHLVQSADQAAASTFDRIAERSRQA